VEANHNFSLLRKILRAIGLSPEATDDIIDRINDFVSDKVETKAGSRPSAFLQRLENCH
jgi:hypothetical protein